MEEKLYFKPEGKEGKQNKKNDHKTFKIVVFTLVIIAMIIVIIWIIRGKKIITGTYPENVKNESLSCVSRALYPPKIETPDTNNQEVKINGVFGNDGLLKSLSFIYTLVYETADDAYAAESRLHANFNKALAGSGYSVDQFKNKFARYDNKLIITLNTELHSLDEFSGPYFMLDNPNSDRSLEDFMKDYSTQGFDCTSTKD